MGGYSPPNAGTRLQLPDGTEYDGTVKIAGGSTLIPRPSALYDDTIVLDVPRQVAPAPSGLFVPDVSTFPATTLVMPTNNAYLTLAEILIAGTTPAAGTDASNCYELQIDGTAQGAQTIPMSTVGGRRFAYNAYESEDLGGHSRHNYADTGYACRQRFELSSDITISALQFNSHYNSPYGWYAWDDPLKPFVQMRGVILNADLEYIAATAYHVGGPFGADTWIQFNLEQSVELQQGMDYWVGIEFTDKAAIGCASNGGATYNYGAVTTLGGDMLVADSPGSAQLATRNAAGILGFGLIGTVTGLIVGGDVQLTLASRGTPPNAPTDVNLRFNWLSSASV